MLIDITITEARLLLRHLAQTAKKSRQPRRDLDAAETVGRKIKAAVQHEKKC